MLRDADDHDPNDRPRPRMYLAKLGPGINIRGGVLANRIAIASSAFSQMESFSCLAGRKAIFLLALIRMASPVAGLRPMRAAR